METITIENDEEFLRQVSKPVNINDTSLLNDIKEIEKFCKENDVMAIASILIGIPKRIIYLKNTDFNIINKIQKASANTSEINYDENKILLNPKVISQEGLTTYWEASVGCLDYLGLVKRPYKTIVEYMDIEGKIHRETFEGFSSTVLSHELDLLEGILHIDKSDELLIMNENKRKEFRVNHGYKIISKTGNYEDLLQKEKTKKKVNKHYLY